MTPTPTLIDLHHLVRKSRAADLPAMSRILAAALDDDPVVRWMLPDESRRVAVLPDLMRLFASRFQAHGENHVNDTGTAAAIWAPPHAAFDPADDAWFEAELAGLAGDDLPRIGAMVDLLDAHHTHVPHYYLNLVGVVPDQQDRGVGTALLDAVLDRADRQGAATYVEASAPRNRALFQRHGFVVLRELRCDDSPPVWTMWRQPQG